VCFPYVFIFAAYNISPFIASVAEKARRFFQACTSTRDGTPSEIFRLSSGTDPSPAPSTVGKPVITLDDAESFVDAIVIDNDVHSLRKTGTKSASETGGSQSQHTGSGAGNHMLDAHDDNSYYQGGFRSWIRWRAWPQVAEFFEPRMPDEKTEREFQAQSWHANKSLALSVFYLEACQNYLTTMPVLPRFVRPRSYF
jgi:hypothetical protein